METKQTESKIRFVSAVHTCCFCKEEFDCKKNTDGFCIDHEEIGPEGVYHYCEECWVAIGGDDE
jgi:hypothetical protein